MGGEAVFVLFQGSGKSPGQKKEWAGLDDWKGWFVGEMRYSDDGGGFKETGGRNQPLIETELTYQWHCHFMLLFPDQISEHTDFIKWSYKTTFGSYEITFRRTPKIIEILQTTEDCFGYVDVVGGQCLILIIGLSNEDSHCFTYSLEIYQQKVATLKRDWKP